MVVVSLCSEVVLFGYFVWVKSVFRGWGRGSSGQRRGEKKKAKGEKKKG
jgi:hypothetical protein